MDFAAAPIVNIPAQPARPDAVAADDASSFRDHMAAERAVDAQRAPLSDQSDAAEPESEDKEQANDQAVAPPVALTAPLLVQIAATESVETPASSTESEPTPIAPSAAAPPLTPASAPVQQPKQAAPKDQSKFEPQRDAEAEDDTPPAQASPQSSAVAETPGADAAPPQPAPAPALTQALEPSADALAALQVNTPSAIKSQTGKANTEAIPKLEGAVEAMHDTPPPQATEPTKAQGKTANPHANAQAESAETPFQPVQEAPAPPQTQAQSQLQLQTPSSHASTQVLQSGGDQSALRAAPAAVQVGREIIRRFNGHNTQFDLRLDPPELGRVDVRLEVSRDHRVTATISADTPQALAEMARHARELEQSLQSAGLELADNGLSFDLHQGSGEERKAGDENASVQTPTLRLEDEVQTIAQRARPVGFERWRGVRVDVMA